MLPNTIEGLVHMSCLTDDYYRYDERHYALIGERTGSVFRIGDEVKVRCIGVDKAEHAIDFEIVGMKGKRKGKEKKIIVTSVSSKKSDHRKKKAKKSGRKKENGKKSKGKKAKKFYEPVPSLKRPGKRKKKK